jgi:hypothetical protein
MVYFLNPRHPNYIKSELSQTACPTSERRLRSADGPTPLIAKCFFGDVTMLQS